MTSLKYAIFAGALTMLGAGSAAAHEPKQTIVLEDAEALAFQNTVGYSDAVIAGGMIDLSGVPAAIRGPTARGAELPGE